MELNQAMIINNIYLLAKKNGVRISDLESAAGLSSGYLSKLRSEDNNSIPSVEALNGIAKKLGVSVDSLINVDFNALSPDEEYTICFIDSLIQKTVKNEARWRRLARKMLENQEMYKGGSTEYPMFTHNNAYVFYDSKFYENETPQLDKDSYLLPLGNGSTLYLMSIKVIMDDVGEKDIEMYIETNNYLNPICTALTGEPENTFFKDKLYQLYDAAANSCSRVRLSANLKDVMDRFMPGYVEKDDDDDDDGLPF